MIVIDSIPPDISALYDQVLNGDGQQYLLTASPDGITFQKFRKRIQAAAVERRKTVRTSIRTKGVDGQPPGLLVWVPE